MGENSSSQTMIGAFVIGGIILIMASIFFLGADKSVFSSYARVHAHFDNVQGLAEGSVVTVSGVNIGNVENILFLSDSNLLDVVMKVEMRHLHKIKSGSLAEIRTQGALGDKFIYIIPGDPRQKTIHDGDRIEVAKATDIFGIFADRGKETERVFDIINEIYKMTKSINTENRIDRILNNLNTTSANLNLASVEMKKLASSMNDEEMQGRLKSSVRHFEKIISKIDRGEGTMGALINDSSLHEQLKSFLGANPRKQQLRSVLRTSIQNNDKDDDDK
ncbi:MAG: MlaD family protein [Pseudobdellovibrionaceae bacterium]|jgi:phospholipid/cholesterol/gamma-HCH transport system substrate-binding protein